MAMAISYNNWLFQWDYTFYKYYKWGFLSTYNWYNSGHNCRSGWPWLSIESDGDDLTGDPPNSPSGPSGYLLQFAMERSTICNR